MNGNETELILIIEGAIGKLSEQSKAVAHDPLKASQLAQAAQNLSHARSIVSQARMAEELHRHNMKLVTPETPLEPSAAKVACSKAARCGPSDKTLV